MNDSKSVSKKPSRLGGSDHRIKEKVISDRPITASSIATVSRKGDKRPFIKSDMDDFKARILGAM